MAKLIIQIPCWNEAETLPATLCELPRSVEGFDEVEIMVVDDGSSDKTVEVARNNGADHVVALPFHQGLARTFMAGVQAALRRGATVIVNTDADNQYRGADVARLTKPILDGRAQIVVGARPISSIEHFSLARRWLQRLGSWVVRIASNTQVADAPSGFRAFHSDAAMRLFVYSEYTYTLETIIQAGLKGIPIVSVPIEVNPPTRPSRLIRNNWQYIIRSAVTVVRLLVLYKPLRLFLMLAACCAMAAFAIGLRYVVLDIYGSGGGHVQSLLVAVILSITSVMFAVVGVVCDLIAANRLLLEDLRYRLSQHSPPLID